MTVDWREMFYKYINIVGRNEGTDFIDWSDWDPDEYRAISDLFHDHGELDPEEASDLYWKNHPSPIVQIPTAPDHPEARPCTIFTGHLCKGHDGKCPR